MAGIEASMTLGGVAYGDTYLLARGLRQARSDTIGVNDVLVPAPAGLRGTLPDRCLHVVSRGSEPHSRSSRCPKIRTKAPLLNSRKPAASDSLTGASVGVVALPCCYWAISPRTWTDGSQRDERLRGGTRSDPRRLSRHRRLFRRDAIDRRAADQGLCRILRRARPDTV